MQKSVSTILAVFLALSCGQVIAQTAGTLMPTETDTRDGSSDDVVSSERPAAFGRVPWVLVVEAVRTAKGDLVPWEGDSDWSRLWRVPGQVGGTRYVPVDGDAEDRLHVRSTEKIKDALPGGLSFLSGKYRAPAIALVVREVSGVAVIPWRGGYGTWSRTTLPADAPSEDAKAEALKLIAQQFSVGDRRDEVAGTARLQGRVLAFRETSGTVQYQVMVRGRVSQQELLKLVGKAAGLAVTEIVTTADGYDLVLSDRSGAPEPIERRLTRAGLQTEPGGRQPRDAQSADSQE
jgi:hypothetical protein